MDSYEAFADWTASTKLYVFSMRSMANGAAFDRAYPCATQQTFLEAHELPLAHFEGVFHVFRYDNLTSAGKYDQKWRVDIVEQQLPEDSSDHSSDGRR